MKRKKGLIRRIVLNTAIAVLATAVLSGCGGGSGTSSTPAPKTALNTSIRVEGSSAVLPLVKKAIEGFKLSNPDVSIDPGTGQGSGAGLTAVYNKTVDIGTSDIEATEGGKLTVEQAASLVDTKLCIVGVGVAVHPRVYETVKNLTSEQLIGIYTGTITNWKEVGGPDQRIAVFVRKKGSGTRTLFEKMGLGLESGKTVNDTKENFAVKDSNGELADSIANTPWSIGYIALSYKEKQLNFLKIDGVEPSYENIYEGKYKIWGYEHMFTNGAPTGVVKEFLDYMTSPAFEPEIEKMGYGVISKLKVR